MSFTNELSELVAETVSRLTGISKKRMFGCDAFFRSGQIFALIWKTGRIGVRLPDNSIYNALMASEGAEPWQVYDKPSAKPMKHWVLVPEAFHDDTLELASWLGQAYTLAAATNTVVMAKKPVAKKPVAKKPVAKKPVAKKPVAKKPVAKKPVAKKPVA
ncbi:MAG: TfoX/Sxy family protein, partial [Kofleriaceae bacterium]|nr:TfoX/Sxy family protein [Kofleriaceae bacterium]